MLLPIPELERHSQPELVRAELRGINIGVGYFSRVLSKCEPALDEQNAKEIRNLSRNVHPFWVRDGLLDRKYTLIANMGLLARVFAEDNPHLWTTYVYGQDGSQRPPVDVRGGPLFPDTSDLHGIENPIATLSLETDFLGTKFNTNLSEYEAIADVNVALGQGKLIIR